MGMSHRDGDPDKTQEEYDRDNHADQENSNNDEYDKWEEIFSFPFLQSMPNYPIELESWINLQRFIYIRIFHNIT
jgi:hypothetical protein